MELYVFTHPLEVKELLEHILSYCLDEAGAYYVSTRWFWAVDDLLGKAGREKNAYACQVAAALRVGFAGRDWRGYRFLAQAKRRREIAVPMPWHIWPAADFDGEQDSDREMNLPLCVFHNVMLLGGILTKKVSAPTMPLGFAHEVVLEYDFEMSKDPAALGAETLTKVENGVAQGFSPGPSFDMAFELNAAPCSVEVAAEPTSLMLALELAAGHGRVPDSTHDPGPWQRVRDDFVTFEREGDVSDGSDDRELLKLVVVPKGGQHGAPAATAWSVAALYDGKAMTCPDYLKDALEAWFANRALVNIARRTGAAVSVDGAGAAQAGDVKELLKSCCVTGYLDG